MRCPLIIFILPLCYSNGLIISLVWWKTNPTFKPNYFSRPLIFAIYCTISLTFHPSSTTLGLTGPLLLSLSLLLYSVMRFGWLRSYYLGSWLVLQLVVTRLPDRRIVGMEVHWVCSYPGRTSRTQFLRDLVLEYSYLELLHAFQQKEDYKDCLHIKEKKVMCLLSPHVVRTVNEDSLGFWIPRWRFRGLELLQVYNPGQKD